MPLACLPCHASLSLDKGAEADALKSKKMSIGRLARARELSEFLKTVPEVKHAFAYGSGVFQQQGLYKNNGDEGDRPMLDFILAVDDPVSWHNQNIEQNRQHYSSIAWGGGKSVACNSERLGAGVHFNPSVAWEREMVKYGVIRKSLLCRDLLNWDRLYVAGRMQKPVLTLLNDKSIEQGNHKNRISCLVTSLLLLPKKFRIQDLMKTIVGLSYLGDIRMGLAEDSRKIDRIASSSSAGLEEIYRPLLEEDKDLSHCCSSSAVGNNELWEQDFSPGARAQLVCALPQAVQQSLATRAGGSGGNAAELAEKLVRSQKYRERISDSIASIVGPSSRGQAVAGLFMAGPGRSSWYVMQKLKKKYLQ